MNTNTSMSKTGVVALAAIMLLVISCADKRGFDTKRLMVPTALDRVDQQGGGDNNNDDDASLIRVPIFSDIDLRNGISNAVDDNKVKVGDSQIVYVEGGNETVVTEEEIENIKSELSEVALATKNLPVEKQFLKGLSLTLLEGGTADKMPIELMGVVESGNQADYFATRVVMTKKSEGHLSGNSVQFSWTKSTLNFKSEVSARCSSKGQDLCSQITVALQLFKGEEYQVFLIEFISGENGYIISRASTPILNFEDAQNGQKAIGAEEDQNQQNQEDTPDVGVTPENGVEVEQGEADTGDKANTSDQAELSPGDANSEEQKPAETGDKKESAAPASPKTPSARQAEDASMEALRKMQAEEKAKSTAAEAKAKSTVTPRQAEDASMEALRKMQAEEKAKSAAEAKPKSTVTHRQAEDASMEALRKMQAEEKAKSAAEAKAKSTVTHRQAEDASMKALQKAKTPSARQAEDASMEKFRHQKKIDKILKDNSDADFRDI